MLPIKASLLFFNYYNKTRKMEDSGFIDLVKWLDNLISFSGMNIDPSNTQRK